MPFTKLLFVQQELQKGMLNVDHVYLGKAHKHALCNNRIAHTILYIYIYYYGAEKLTR